MAIVLIVWITLSIGFVSGAAWCAAFRSAPSRPTRIQQPSPIAVPLARTIERCAKPSLLVRLRLRRNRADLRKSLVTRVWQ